MKTRQLGRNGLQVSAIGLGCMGLSFGLGPASDKGYGIKVIRDAFERGVTFFDTAEGYGPFTNEELVGEALQPIRDQVVIATKFGFKIDGNGATVGLHELLALREELAVGFVSWGPLGQGFLTGQITPDMKFDDPSDLRNTFPRFTKEALKANFAVVEFLRDLGRRKGFTPAQIALAWLLAQRPSGVPIPGATRLEHLDDNVPAAEVELTAGDLQEIDTAFATLDVEGAPLSPELTALGGQ